MLAFAEHHPLLVFGLLVAFSILTSVARTFLGLLSGKPARQHGRVVVDYVQKHGYQLLNPVLAQKLDASVFNISQTPPLHSSSGPVPFRVAKVQVDGLPRFSLEPRSAATVVETVVGKLLHQPESTIELDPGQHASFGSRYRLRGADRTAVVEFFTPERIRFIEAEQLPGTFASNARYLVYYESTAMRTEADYDAFMAVV